jgi:DHA1 family tetracycline resistance protein-like MFS transporter
MNSLLAPSRAASKRFILATVFLDVLGIGLIIPVLPALVGHFTTSPDDQAHWYGVLAATFGVMQFLCMPMLGALSDHFGRRPVLLLSIFGLGCSYFVNATATSLAALLAVRILSGATSASFSVANAYMADITPPEQRAKGFGLLGAAFGMGFIIGPVVGGVLGDVDIRLPFYIAAGLAMLNWFYGFFVLPESLPAERRTPFALKRINPFSALAHLSQLHGVGPLLTIFALTVFPQFILHTTWVLYTTFRFGWTPTDNGLALFVVGLMSAVVQGGLQGRLIQRFGEQRLALLGLISAACAYFTYGAITVGWLMYLVIFCNLLSFASGPALQAIISKSVSPNEQGLSQGALNAINGLAIVVAPLIGTAVLARVSHLPPGDWRMGASFYVCAALQASAAMLAWRHFRRHPAH